MTYANLHTHTDYSNLRLIDSINKIPQVLTVAKEMGLAGLAITDHEALSGHLKALEFVADKQKEDPSWANFKLVLGNEIYLCRNGLCEDTVEKGERYPHMILLALDNIGHQQLRKLSSRAWERSYMMYSKRVPTWYSDLEDIVMTNPGHIIATSACIGGNIGINFLNDQANMNTEFVQWCHKVFGKDNFFLELAPALYEEQIAYNKYLIELGKSTDTPLTVATDAHYARPEDRDLHSIFLKSKEADRETDAFYKYTYLMTASEVVELMDYVDKEVLEQMFTNTMSIIDRVEGYNLYHSQVIPRLPDERGDRDYESLIRQSRIDGKYAYINKFLTSPFEDDRYGVFLALEQLKEQSLEGENLAKHLARIEMELEEMWVVSEKIEQRLMSYLLTIRTIINRIWSDVGSITGAGRGSGPSSLVCSLLGICDGDPLEQGFDLWFYRFIHRDRAELAD